MDIRAYFRYNVHELAFVIMFILLFFQSILSDRICYVFSYTDELFAVIGLMTLSSPYVRKYVFMHNTYVKRIFKLLLVILIIGCLSTIRYKIQSDLMVNLYDCFALMKMFVICFLGLSLLYRCSLNKVLEIIFFLVCMYILLGGIFGILNLFGDIGMSEEYRFGIRNFRFINSNSGDYASILIIALSIVHLQSGMTGKKYIFLKLLTLFCLILTLRGKAISMVLTYTVLIWLLKYYKGISLKSLAILAMIGFGGAYWQIKFYFVDNITARGLFLLYGLITANNFFPFGAGFSTYGSNMAKVNYSPLYTEYGFSSYYGMSAEQPQFLNDNFWPMIIAQFGWISFILYAFILVLFFKIVNIEFSLKQLKIAGFILFFLLIYSSIGGPIFVHYIGCASILVFSLGIALSQKYK